MTRAPAQADQTLELREVQFDVRRLLPRPVHDGRDAPARTGAAIGVLAGGLAIIDGQLDQTHACLPPEQHPGPRREP